MQKIKRRIGIKNLVRELSENRAFVNERSGRWWILRVLVFLCFVAMACVSPSETMPSSAPSDVVTSPRLAERSLYDGRVTFRSEN